MRAAVPRPVRAGERRSSCCWRAAAPASAQLPAGPGQAETIRLCGTCHPPERGASVRLTREGWEDVIAKMVGLGAKGTDAELDAVLEYLSTHFKGEAAVPLNLNRATSVELESIAGLLRRESAAWIAYRAKRPCTTVDDLQGGARRGLQED